MPDQRPSGPYVRYVIGLLCVVTAFNYMDRMALAVLSPLVQADLQLSDAQLGLLIGFAFSVFYAVCGIPIGRWADRGVRRDIIAAAIGLWSVMTALTGAAQTFWHLFLARVGVGVGESGSITPGASLLCDYVPLKRRAGALAIMAFGTSVGVLSGMTLAGWLGEMFNWRVTFVLLGLPGLLLALVVRLTLREPARAATNLAGANDAPPSLGETVIFLYRCRTYRMVLLYLVANGFVQYGLNQWWPSFFSRLFALTPSSVGLYLGTAIGACGGIGVLMGGVIADKCVRHGLRRPLVIGAAAMSLSIPMAVGSLFAPSVGAAGVFVAVTALLWGIPGGAVLAAQYSVVTSRMRAAAGSIAIFLSSVLGFGLGPFSVGIVSDLLAPSLGAASLRYALLLPVVATVFTVVALLAAAKVLPDDLAAVGAVETDDVTAIDGSRTRLRGRLGHVET